MNDVRSYSTFICRTFQSAASNVVYISKFSVLHIMMSIVAMVRINYHMPDKILYCLENEIIKIQKPICISLGFDWLHRFERTYSPVDQTVFIYHS